MKNAFTIKLIRGKNYSESFLPPSTFTLGRSYKSDIIATPEFLPDKYIFLRKNRRAVSLFLLKGMKGSFKNANATIPLEDLIASGTLKRKNSYFVLDIPETASGTILLGDSKIDFGFFPVIKAKKKPFF